MLVQCAVPPWGSSMQQTQNCETWANSKADYSNELFAMTEKS